jgi:hypothetical protein
MDIVQHRFNTAQRETLNSKYKNIWYDDLVSDDYDFQYQGLDSTKTGDGNINGFSVSSYTINKSVMVDERNQIQYKEIPGNILPEGYFYNPYSRIMIRELSTEVSKVIGRVINFDYNNIGKEEVEVGGETYYATTFTTVIPSKLVKNDILGIYNNETKELVWGIIENVDDNVVTILTEDDINIDSTYSIISTEEGVPSFATYLPSSHSFVWKPIVLMSELENDSELLNMPFSNGRHYIEKNINLYVKRQDPRGEFGLFVFDKRAKYKSRLSSYRIRGWEEIDLSGLHFNNGGLLEICY